MFQKLISTSDDVTLTILRLALGIVFFAHGAQKALGWFGGYAFSGTMGFFTQQTLIVRGSSAFSIDHALSKSRA